MDDQIIKTRENLLKWMNQVVRPWLEKVPTPRDPAREAELFTDLRKCEAREDFNRWNSKLALYVKQLES